MCRNTNNLVEEARNLHDLSPDNSSPQLERLLTISTIMGVEMKNETDKLTVQFTRKWTNRIQDL